MNVQWSDKLDQVNWDVEVTQCLPELVMFNAVESFAVNETHGQIFLLLTSLFNNPSDIGNVISSTSHLPEANLTWLHNLNTVGYNLRDCKHLGKKKKNLMCINILDPCIRSYSDSSLIYLLLFMSLMLVCWDIYNGVDVTVSMMNQQRVNQICYIIVLYFINIYQHIWHLFRDLITGWN